MRELSIERKYQKKERYCYRILCDYFHLLNECEKKHAPKQPDSEWHPLFVEALQRKSYIEYLLDSLLYGSLEDKQALVAEQENEVRKLEQRITECCTDQNCGRCQEFVSTHTKRTAC